MPVPNTKTTDYLADVDTFENSQTFDKTTRVHHIDGIYLKSGFQRFFFKEQIANKIEKIRPVSGIRRFLYSEVFVARK
jgi:hypothetical protein